MKHTQQSLDFTPRPKLRLSEIERIIRKSRAIVPPPSRRRLIELCESGKLEAVKVARLWLVFEDSFVAWLREMDEGPR